MSGQPFIVVESSPTTGYSGPVEITASGFRSKPKPPAASPEPENQP